MGKGGRDRCRHMEGDGGCRVGGWWVSGGCRGAWVTAAAFLTNFPAKADMSCHAMSCDVMRCHVRCGDVMF